MTKLFTSVALLASSVAIAAPSPTTTVAPQAATTVAAPAETVKPAPSKITLSFMAETYVDAAPANRNNYDSFESYNHLGIAYKLSDKRKIQYRQYFLYNASDSTRTDEWDLGDHVVQYTDGEAFKIGSAPVSSYLRLYLPGSEYSKEVGKIELRNHNSIDQELPNHFTVSYFLNNRFYGYTNDDDSQRALRILPGVDVTWGRYEAVKPFVTVFTDHSWRHTGKGVNVYGTEKYNAANSDTFYMDYGVNVTPVKNLSLMIYGETYKNMRDNSEFVFADENRTIYNLIVSASM